MPNAQCPMTNCATTEPSSQLKVFMSKTDDALLTQTALLNKFAEIIRNLIQQVSTERTDKDKAVAQIGVMLGADEATAAAIVADNPHIQSLIDDALAVLPPVATAA